jgi:uncharacterized membrane protein YeaQ/YmgE (transglycosylase-associated protein family)
MGFVAWVIFGAIVGWIANLVVGGRARQRLGCLVSVLIGIVGAALGGLGYRLATGQAKTFDFDFPSFGVAILGAVVLLAILRLISSTRRPTGRW